MVSLIEKIKVNGLIWLGHVLRMEGTKAVRLVIEMYVVGKRE